MKSSKGLAWKLGVPLAELHYLADNAESQYLIGPRRIGKKIRVICNPRRRLKRVQTRIHKRLLRSLDMPDHLHGSVAGRSALTNARVHLGQPHLVRIDVADFFPSITPNHVYDAWAQQVDCGPEVAGLLTRLTTVNFSLPQGAPSSPALANLVLASADELILDNLLENGGIMTRYVDDIGISGNNPQAMIMRVAGVLQQNGFRIRRRKIEIMPRSRPQELTGYSVNASAPSLGGEHRSRIRAAIHNLSRLSIDAKEYSAEVTSIRGRIQHLTRTNPGAASRLHAYLEKVVAQSA